jgi:hypothetical protein
MDITEGRKDGYNGRKGWIERKEEYKGRTVIKEGREGYTGRKKGWMDITKGSI